MGSFGLGRRVHEAGTDPGFGRDAVLLLMQSLAGQGAVATVSAGGGATGAACGRRWSFRVPGRGVDVEGATVEQCVRSALPLLREALLTDEGTPESALAGDTGIEGTGILVLDWLVDRGASVFVKADGERATNCWTLLVHGGPLSRFLRADASGAERCFHRMVSLLRAEGVAVPV